MDDTLLHMLVDPRKCKDDLYPEKILNLIQN